MKLRDIQGLMVIIGFLTGTGLLVIGQAGAGWIVWAASAIVLTFGERIIDFMTTSNPILRRQREAREAESMKTWRRATEWERGRADRESQAEADLYIAKLKQDNLRSRTDYDFD